MRGGHGWTLCKSNGDDFASRTPAREFSTCREWTDALINSEPAALWIAHLHRREEARCCKAVGFRAACWGALSIGRFNKNFPLRFPGSPDLYAKSFTSGRGRSSLKKLRALLHRARSSFSPRTPKFTRGTFFWSEKRYFSVTARWAGQA